MYESRYLLKEPTMQVLVIVDIYMCILESCLLVHFAVLSCRISAFSQILKSV